MFAVKLADLSMFSVSGENTFTFKSLEGSSDIFGNGRIFSLVFGNLRQSSAIVRGLGKSYKIIRNCRKMAENALIY